MVRWCRALAATICVAFAAPLGADGLTESPTPPAKDVWHAVTSDSPFFSESLVELRVAAVVQSDDRFARIILAEDGRGAYVTVNLPGSAPADALRSDLVYSNGGIFTRTLGKDMIVAQVMTSSDSVTYSFSIAADDIRVFRGATKWTLTPEGGETTEITLKGSARAIRDALSAPVTLGVPPAEPATQLGAIDPSPDTPVAR